MHRGNRERVPREKRIGWVDVHNSDKCGVQGIANDRYECVVVCSCCDVHDLIPFAGQFQSFCFCLVYVLFSKAAIRVGDVFALLIEYYHSIANYQQAYNIIERVCTQHTNINTMHKNTQQR